jgi:hypothetical protein
LHQNGLEYGAWYLQAPLSHLPSIAGWHRKINFHDARLSPINDPFLVGTIGGLSELVSCIHTAIRRIY